MADWTEMVILVEQRSELNRSQIRRYLDGVADDADLELLMVEIERRSQNAPGFYPFRVEADVVHFDPGGESSVPYEYLLTASFPQAPFRSKRRFARVDRGLDVLALFACRALLSSDAEGLVFAWPPDKQVADRRPTKFIEAVGWLARRMDLAVTGQEVNPNRLDGGVDLVAWRPFRDGRSAFPVLLAQTTIQQSYARKAFDISPRLWCSWISLGCEPMTALVIPCVVPMSSPTWNDMRHSVSLVLDRLRLCELLEGTAVSADPRLDEMRVWLDDEYEQMRL